MAAYHQNLETGYWPDFLPGPPDDPDKLLKLIGWAIFVVSAFCVVGIIASLV